MNEDYLVARLGDYVFNRYALVPRESLKLICDSDWAGIRETLKKWQAQGYIDILAEPETAERYQPCVRLKNFINSKEPLDPHWMPLREEMPPHYAEKWREPKVKDEGQSGPSPK